MSRLLADLSLFNGLCDAARSLVSAVAAGGEFVSAYFGKRRRRQAAPAGNVVAGVRAQIKRHQLRACADPLGMPNADRLCIATENRRSACALLERGTRRFNTVSDR